MILKSLANFFKIQEQGRSSFNMLHQAGSKNSSLKMHDKVIKYLVI